MRRRRASQSGVLRMSGFSWLLMANPNRTPNRRGTARPNGASAPAVSFVGMIRFRFEGSSSRARRNLSPPRRTPLQAAECETPSAQQRKRQLEFTHCGLRIAESV